MRSGSAASSTRRRPASSAWTPTVASPTPTALCARSSGGPGRSSTAAFRPTSSTGLWPGRRRRPGRPRTRPTSPAGAGPRQGRVRRPDGTVRVVQVNDVAVKDKEGGLRTVVATVEDITDRLRLAEDLRQAQQMEALGQLAGGIAHEINTPTQFISDNLSFLTDIWGRSCGHWPCPGAPRPGCERVARRTMSPPCSNRPARKRTSTLSRPRSRRHCPRAKRASSGWRRSCGR